MKQRLFVLLGLPLLIPGCAYRNEKNPETPSSEPRGREISIGYAEVQSRIFKPSCVGCHSGQNAPRLDSYDSIVAHLDRIKARAIVEKTMPKRGPLPAEDRDYLESWIDQKAPQFATQTSSSTPDGSAHPGGGSPTTTGGGAPGSGAPGGPVGGATGTGSGDGSGARKPIHWAELRKQVLVTGCINCHYPNNTGGENNTAISNLDNLEIFKSSIQTIVGISIVTPLMPPPPADFQEGQTNPNQLSKEQKEMLSDWVIDGMLE